MSDPAPSKPRPSGPVCSYLVRSKGSDLISPKKWNKGDRVVHAHKPEWGTGEVLQAEGATQDGVTCQRLTLRFDRAGLKTLSTAFAELKPAAALSPLFAGEASAVGIAEPVPEPEAPTQPLHGATQSEMIELMTRLPEAATDPFLSLRKRVDATLKLFRYGESPSLLLDWAAMQTGLKDPLARFNRHELESYFSRFKLEVEDHLRKIIRDLRKQDSAYFDELIAKGDVNTKRALRKADSFR